MSCRTARFFYAPTLVVAVTFSTAVADEREATPAPTAVSSAAPTAAPSATPKAEKAGMTLRDLLHTFLPASENDNEAAPAAMESDEADLATPDELLSEDEVNQAVPWRAPDFGGQAGALGWSETVFETPKGLESRVAFWRDIYTKYTTDEGLLHDRDNIEIVYEHFDFGAIMSDKSKNVYQKAALREKLVKQKRKEIVERLTKLQKVKSPEALTGEDLRLWKLWENDKDPDKFKDAVSRHRVRFQLGQKDRFFVGIYHSGRYLKEMERIFRDERLPIELTRLPFVESSFNIHARSRVGASGIWQFMRRTARPYMKTNIAIDERNDPLKATRASARLLKSNFMQLNAWPLAVTGYNHGPSGVSKIANKLHTRDLAEIIDLYSSRRFGFASANFYACFLAALDAERNAKKYFGEGKSGAKWGPAVEAVEVRLKKGMMYKTLLDFFDGDATAAELANPHLLTRVRKSRTAVPPGSYVRVPPSRVQLAIDLQSGKLKPAKLAMALKETPAGNMTTPSK